MDLRVRWEGRSGEGEETRRESGNFSGGACLCVPVDVASVAVDAVHVRLELADSPEDLRTGQRMDRAPECMSSRSHSEDSSAVSIA